jgi:hypothetical protein
LQTTHTVKDAAARFYPLADDLVDVTSSTSPGVAADLADRFGALMMLGRKHTLRTLDEIFANAAEGAPATRVVLCGDKG